MDFQYYVKCRDFYKFSFTTSQTNISDTITLSFCSKDMIITLMVPYLTHPVCWNIHYQSRSSRLISTQYNRRRRKCLRHFFRFLNHWQMWNFFKDIVLTALSISFYKVLYLFFFKVWQGCNYWLIVEWRQLWHLDWLLVKGGYHDIKFHL